MRRTGLHFLFWAIYLLQDILLHFTWMEPYLPGIPGHQQVLMALTTATIVLLPKLGMTYFFLYRTIPSLLGNRGRRWRPIGELVLVMGTCVIIFRGLFYYYLTPNVYLGLPGVSPLINTRSVLIAIMEIGFVAGVAGALKLLRTQLMAGKREQELIKRGLEAELKFLRHQTNPHFLFNTLNNIYALSLKNSPDTPEVVMKLSKMLRFILYDTGDGPITVAEEIRLLDDYIELERIRYTDSLAVFFNKDIDNAGQRIAPLLLLPFVENAFKHGASESHFDSFIRIDMKLRSGRLSFTIENTKEDGAPSSPGRSIGIGNVSRQLELMYREYDIKVEDREDIFKVDLFINLDSHGKI